jgi:hypothetical protein
VWLSSNFSGVTGAVINHHNLLNHNRRLPMPVTLASSSHRASQEHMIKQGASSSGLGPFFGDGQISRHFIPRHFVEKSGHNSKKTAQTGYTKRHFFHA